jgi:cytochrome c biogenesis protein CcdA
MKIHSRRHVWIVAVISLVAGLAALRALPSVSKGFLLFGLFHLGMATLVIAAVLFGPPGLRRWWHRTLHRFRG